MTSSHPTVKDSIPAAAEDNPAAVPVEAPKESRLQEEIDRLKEENAKFRDQWIRAVAEADNIRKRSQREMEEAARYSITLFARDMISVMENLTRASESIPNAARSTDVLLNTLGEGVDLTLQELMSSFEKYGIKRINPLNQKFDHNLHQAVMKVERDDMPPGMVVQVVQAGYTLDNRLLKPAMVAVSTPGELSKWKGETV